MNPPQVLEDSRRLLSSLRGRLEEALEVGLRRVAESDSACVSPYHIRMAFEEQWQLSRGEDCCYDRPGTGFAYASWFHARRTHELVRWFLPIAHEMPDRSVVVDLGAGTFASAWALGLTIHALRECGGQAPESIEVFAVDSSRSMLETGDKLWTALATMLPDVARGVFVHSVSSPWVDPPPEARGGWVIAGHLFDASDHPAEVQLQMRRLAARVEPERILIDAPMPKEVALVAAMEGAEDAGFRSLPVQFLDGEIWSGTLPKLKCLRDLHLGTVGVSASRLQRAPTWARRKGTSRADLRRAASPNGRLFTLGPVGLALDEDQDRAAEPADRYELLVGAAGSGKSVVLVERVARTIQTTPTAMESPRILVTTRNVLLADQLTDWLLDRLGRTRFSYEHSGANGDHTIEWPHGSSQAFVRVLNWDKIPTRLLGIRGSAGPDSDAIRRRVRRKQRDGWEPMRRYERYLGDVDWLCAELRRVIYGMNIRSLDDYLTTPRPGRQVKLDRHIRQHVWELLMSPGQSGYTMRWREVADGLGKEIPGGRGEPVLTVPSFSHAFVDEFQDLTPTDFHILAAMVPDARRIFAAGDAAQAMLLSTTFDAPGYLRGGDGQERQRQVIELTHSYRMSRRIAEAVAPLAEWIIERSSQGQRRWVGIPRGTRSGVLGCRPVVLLADGAETAQLADVLTHVAPFDRSDEVQVTIAETRSDGCLRACLEEMLPNAAVRCEIMARIKGLERDLVVWRTSDRIPSDESAEQTVHTILTRARSLAVIMLDPSATPNDVVPALAAIRQNRLLFWTKSAEAAWNDLVGLNDQ